MQHTVLLKFSLHWTHAQSACIHCVALCKLVKAFPANAPCHVADHTCIAGSAVYTSPEGLDYFHKPQEYLIQGAADMFSMGCVLFQLLTDLPAFMRPEDQFGEELTIHDLHQLALWRQAKWVSSFSATGIVWA